MADRKIDCHAHFVPECYHKALLDNDITEPDGMPGIPAWSAESHLEYMNVGVFFNVFFRTFGSKPWIYDISNVYFLAISESNSLTQLFYCVLCLKKVISEYT